MRQLAWWERTFSCSKRIVRILFGNRIRRRFPGSCGTRFWWTRIRREDEDLFLPLDAGPLRRKRVRLNCSIGRWQNQPAYSVDLWDNPEWESGRNLSGAVVQVLGRPPKGLRPTVKNEVFTAEISKTRGRHVRPVFYHRAGLPEYVWFSHRAAVPAILYDH